MFVIVFRAVAVIMCLPVIVTMSVTVVVFYKDLTISIQPLARLRVLPWRNDITRTFKANPTPPTMSTSLGFSTSGGPSQLRTRMIWKSVTGHSPVMSVKRSTA